MVSLELSDVGPKLCDSDLIRAIDSGNSRRLLGILRSGFDVNQRDELTGGSYLHRVITKTDPSKENIWVPFVYILSNAGIDLDSADREGNTVVHLAIKRCLLEMMVACLKAGATEENVDDGEQLISKYAGFFAYEFHNWYRKLVPGLWETVKNNQVFRVNKLVKSWCRVNVHRNNESLIEYAKRIHADKKLVDHLVNNEASIDFAHATIAGDDVAMKMLLCNESVKLDIYDFSQRADIFSPLTPLSLKEVAKKYKQTHVLYLLGEPNYLHPKPQMGPSAVCAIL